VHCSLVEPSPHLFGAFLQMSDDYLRAGEARYQREGGWTPEAFAEFLCQLTDQGRGIGLALGKTPVITSWLLDGTGRIVGVSRLRPILTDELLNEGGNIGYDVPPSCRRKGFGTELLRQTLAKARLHGLGRVLVTCNEDNEGSRRIIERCGGTLASKGISEDDGAPLLRFWIEFGLA
jgi:predicted acetyltransferase